MKLADALAMLADPPWGTPVDRGVRSGANLAGIDIPDLVARISPLVTPLRRGETGELVRWMTRDPANAAHELLLLATQRHARLAWMALRLLAVRHEGSAVIARAADALGPHVRAQVDRLRLDDPLRLHPVELPQIPPAVLAGLPRVTLGERELTDDEVRRLLELFSFPSSLLPHPAQPVLRAALAAESRAALARAVFAIPHRHIRLAFVTAVAQLGDAVMHAGLERLALDEPDGERYVEALAATHVIWRCRLAMHGSRHARDLARHHLDLADLATDALAELTADERTIVEAVCVRALEWAMVDRRRWPLAGFARMAAHPVIGPALGRIVFGCYVGAEVRAFHLDPKRGPLDAAAQPLELAGAIGVCHPVELGAERARFAHLVHDAAQPFEQLRRTFYTLTDAERDAPSLDALHVPMIPGRLLALLTRGWRQISDGKFVRGYARVYGGLEVAIELAGTPRSAFREFAGAPNTGGPVNVVLGHAGARDASQYLCQPAPWGELDPVDASEILRAIHRCVADPAALVEPPPPDPVAEAGLLAAIHDGDDDDDDDDHDAALLAYADWLQLRRDPRGELVILEHRERTQGLTDPRSIMRLLELAAAHGFSPHAPDEILPFVREPRLGFRYSLEHGGHHYTLRYDERRLIATIDHQRGFSWQLDYAGRYELTDAETNLVLVLVSAAIRDGHSLAELVIPLADEIAAHPHHRAGALPEYPVPDQFLGARGGLRVHQVLRARDRDRWHRLWDRWRALTR